MSKPNNCANCAFFEFVDEPAGAGQCLRYPPVPMLMPNNNSIMGAHATGLGAINPPVTVEHGCGEHETRAGTIAAVN